MKVNENNLSSSNHVNNEQNIIFKIDEYEKSCDDTNMFRYVRTLSNDILETFPN